MKISTVLWFTYINIKYSTKQHHVLNPIVEQELWMIQLLLYYMRIGEIVDNVNLVSILYHYNIFKSYHYDIGKESCIYFIDFHLDYFQLKFVSIYASTFSFILLISIRNIFE